MRKNILVIIFLLQEIILNNLYGQTTLILQPGSALGKDSYVESLLPTTNLGTIPELNSEAWTVNSVPMVQRGIVEFDLSSIPSNAVILSAYLTLYNNPNSSNGFQDGAHSHFTGSNESLLQRVTSSWQENTVTWNNQPATTIVNEVLLPQDTTPHQDYTADVTALVQDMINNPGSSFGFMVKLVTEQHYRCLLFASSDHPNSALHPRLEITYNICENGIVLQPDSVLGQDAHIASNYLNTNFGWAGELNADAWTASGNPFVQRGIIEFDLSSIPSNAIVQTAALTLYYNPNSSNAQGYHSQLSGSNDAWLRRVTSAWQENVVTWSNQPSYTTTNEVSVAASSSPTQDYVIDVTTLVQDMVNNPSTSFGFILMLQTEQYYRALLFASSDHPNSALHPKLNVCYNVDGGASVNNNIKVSDFNFFPNPAATELTVNFSKETNGVMQLLNALGECVITRNLIPSPSPLGEGSTSVDVSHLVPGIYFITVTDQAGNKVTKKVVKM